MTWTQEGNGVSCLCQQLLTVLLVVQAVKMMHSMMSSMSPEQLAAMSKASGHELSPEQARSSIRLGCVLCASGPVDN